MLSTNAITGGHTRARACYHKHVLRCSIPQDWLWNLPEPTLSCATCQSRLELGRNWYHLHTGHALAEGDDTVDTNNVCCSKFPRNSSGVDLCVKHFLGLSPDAHQNYTQVRYTGVNRPAMESIIQILTIELALQAIFTSNPAW